MITLRENETIAVRQALPVDAAEMAAIHARCFQHAWDEAAMSQFVGGPGCLVLLASRCEAEKPEGLLIVRAAADEAEILTVCVLPDHRRSGLGRALLRTAIAMLEAAGIKRLYLEVEEENEAALALYRSLGAVPVGRRARYYEGGADAAIFSLALSRQHPDDDK